jgi:hypothetical protein
MLITLIGVANVARNLLVFSFQGKVGLIMIVLGISPCHGVVAVGALFAQAAQMGVVIFVAGMTYTRCLCVCLAAIMAAVTGNLEMGVL